MPKRRRLPEKSRNEEITRQLPVAFSRPAREDPHPSPTHHLLDDLFDELPEAVLRILQVNMINELCDDFRVRFRLKVIPLQLEELLDVLVIGHDAVVHHHERVVRVRALRVRVELGGRSVGRPTGVRDAHVRRAELGVEILVLEFCGKQKKSAKKSENVKMALLFF